MDKGELRVAKPVRCLRAWGLSALALLVALALAAPPAYADPPPWAPAWGYRAKHKHKHKHGHPQYVAAPLPFGLDLGHCNRETIGAILGGAAGGLAGTQIGKGDGRTAAIIGGAVLGVLVGGAIGRSMDRADQHCIGQVLEHVPDGQEITWNGPRGERYEVRPTGTWEADSGRYCREYQTTVLIGGRPESAYGRACRQPDGSWQRVG